MLRTLCVAGLFLAAVAAFADPAPSEGLHARKLRVLMSANEAKTTQSSWTYRWALDAEWERKPPKNGMGIEIGLKSEYARDQDRETADRLRASMRMVHNGYGKDAWDWRPVLLVQTEGDHSGEQISTLAAVGYRLKFTSGYFEVTTGVSKDLRTAGAWIGDTGIESSYERRINDKLKIRTGPRAGVATVGAVRLRDDQVRYSWDTSIDYQIDKTVGIGYRLSQNNTTQTKRTQMLGLTFNIK
jgi:hypothetical protein